jgi:hypothetical protein
LKDWERERERERERGREKERLSHRADALETLRESGALRQQK